MMINNILQLFEPYSILKFLHILMAGLWLGMDIGVYNAAKKLRDPNLSIETRANMGKLAGFLDMGPRSAVIVLLMLGITMTFLGEWGTAGGYETELAFMTAIFGAVWLTGLWHQYWVDHPNLLEKRPIFHLRIQSTFRTADIMIRVLISATLAFIAIWSMLLDNGPIEANWLSIKLILFAIIISCGIGIRIYIPQARTAIAEIFDKGSSPDREKILALNRKKSLFFVKGIWILVALIIWISVAKV